MFTMNYKQEEQRVKGVLAGLVPAQPPLGHSRAKWDSRITSDLNDVIKTIGIYHVHSQSRKLEYDIHRWRKNCEVVEPANTSQNDTTHFSGPVLAMGPQCAR